MEPITIGLLASLAYNLWQGWEKSSLRKKIERLEQITRTLEAKINDLSTELEAQRLWNFRQKRRLKADISTLRALMRDADAAIAEEDEAKINHVFHEYKSMAEGR